MLKIHKLLLLCLITPIFASRPNLPGIQTHHVGELHANTQAVLTQTAVALSNFGHKLPKSGTLNIHHSFLNISTSNVLRFSALLAVGDVLFVHGPNSTNLTVLCASGVMLYDQCKPRPAIFPKPQQFLSAQCQEPHDIESVQAASSAQASSLLPPAATSQSASSSHL